MPKKTHFAFVLLLACLSGSGAAFDLVFSAEDTTNTPAFSEATTWEFSIPIDVPIAMLDFENPALGTIDYEVRGTLSEGVPSGFSNFRLVRTIDGPDFYGQGSSLRFSIAPGAILHDGLQIADLAGPDPVFVLNAREVDTGRYHPPLFQLNSDGTGSIRNSNNTGGINPASQLPVDTEFGDEYITDITFDPATFTLAEITIDGDFDENGSFNCGDIDAMVNAIASQSNNLAFDLNKDNQLDFADVESWLIVAGIVNTGSPYVSGDANFDGIVDTSDFNIWNENRLGNASGYCSGDFTADGVVDVSDFEIWNEHRFTSSSRSNSQAVPEPSVLLHFGLAALLCTAMRRRKSQRDSDR